MTIDRWWVQTTDGQRGAGGRERGVRNGEAEFGESEPDDVYTYISII